MNRELGDLAHPEVLPPDPTDRGVELDSVDLGAWVVDTESARSRPRGVAEDRHAFEGPPQQRGNCEVGIPFPSRQDRVCAPQRMDGDALVQLQNSAPIRTLEDTDVLVARGLLVQQAALGLDRAWRNHDESREDGRHKQVASAEQEARRCRQERGNDEKRPLCAHGGDEDKRR